MQAVVLLAWHGVDCQEAVCVVCAVGDRTELHTASSAGVAPAVPAFATTAAGVGDLATPVVEGTFTQPRAPPLSTFV